MHVQLLIHTSLNHVWFSTDRANERDQLIQSLGSENEDGIRAVLDQVSWTPNAIQDLQDSLLSSNERFFCIGSSNVSTS